MPFGHEYVLYSMLDIRDPSQYPWRVRRTFRAISADEVVPPA
jgi:hypothetical protein